MEIQGGNLNVKIIFFVLPTINKNSFILEYPELPYLQISLLIAAVEKQKMSVFEYSSCSPYYIPIQSGQQKGSSEEIFDIRKGPTACKK